jgi:alkylated DNA nucleotide flippase Atl1
MDYAVADVIPVSDPNNTTMAQRVVQYQAVLQMAQQAPQIYNLPQLHRQMIEVMGIKNADKLIPLEDDTKPSDPVSENMNALNGNPMKAFIYQDHAAHIATHQSFMQDPQIAAIIGQNPAAQQIGAALQAHMAEHTAFEYRKQMEEKLGAPLPAPNQDLPEDVEVLLAQTMAQAGQQLTQQKQAQAAQQQAQAAQQDPVMQMQQKELQLKEAEVQRKAQKDQTDAQLAAARLQLDQEKASNTATLEAGRIAAQTEQASAKQDLDEAKALLDLAKTQAKESGRG